jgi:hypothetical protein
MDPCPPRYATEQDCEALEWFLNLIFIEKLDNDIFKMQKTAEALNLIKPFCYYCMKVD